MIKKGIILAGGLGTRMSPLTKAINKQLLPIYDKPLIFYPLSILMLAGIKDILIIVNQGQLAQFKKIFPESKNLGIKINFAQQKYPGGLPEAFIIGEKFIGKNNVALILGDNFFYGQSLTEKLKDCTKLQSGAKIFLHPVSNPSQYGVVKINKKNKILKIVEKPKKHLSDLAITGLYFFDNKVIGYSENLKPSKRKEIEIVDLLKKYKNLIISRTFSKAYGLAGLRVGYIVSNIRIAKLLFNLKPMYEINSIGVEASIMMLKNLKIHKNYISETKKGLKLLVKYFENNNISIIKTHANFIYINLGKKINYFYKKN